MGLGPTLVGGVIGAAVGVGLHVAGEMSTGFEAPWFAIIIGLLTGLGARQANKAHASQVSYLRGAVTAGIALAAIVGGMWLLSMVASRREAKGADGAAVAKAGAGAKGEDAADKAGDAAADATPKDDAAATSDREAGTRRTWGGEGKTPANGGMGQTPFNTLMFIYIAAGTLIAYEFGRGSGSKGSAELAPRDEPVAMDPSN